MSGLTRSLMVALMTLMASISLAVPALAEVNCNNGNYCPDGNACLKGGQCGVMVEAPPGSFKTSSGIWCEPGFREHKYKPGSCSPISYSDCRNGSICPAGSTCNDDKGTCDGGGPATGPQCGNFRCEEGRVCSSSGRCMNPVYFQDCGGGTICSKNKACAEDGGCAIVGIGRTQQIPYSGGGRRNNSIQ